MVTISDIHATLSQDVWPVASRMVDVYRGGGGIGGFGGYYSGLQHKGPSAPYLQFSAGGSKAKTHWDKYPGVETTWPEAINVDANGPHLRVEIKNHYTVLPDRPLGEATIDLRALPPSGQVVDLQLLDIGDRDKPVMASVTFTVKM